MLPNVGPVMGAIKHGKKEDQKLGNFASFISFPEIMPPTGETER